MTATTPPTAQEQDLALTLPDGRVLSHAVLGDPRSATTVIVLDGPGSRGLARALAPEAERRGLRLVAPDRPGFLRSTARPGRSFTDVAADIVALADHLGAGRVGVVAQSGGTPYALALAAAAPDRVAALALVGPIVPLGDPGALDDVGGPMRGLFVLARRAPFLLRPALALGSRQARRDPEKVARRVVDGAPEADRRVMEDPALFAMHVRTTSEALATPATFAQEARLLVGPWDVDLAAVRCPRAIWVGEHDVTHPPSMARSLAARLGDPPVTVVPRAGTFAMLPVYGDVLAFAARPAA
jgi:pimeloyl-ACP methyl ester carboxylesterase